MPYCPSCHAEYTLETRRCSDCNVDLVESLPEEPDQGKLVELASFPNVSEAEMIQELLESNGIATDLRGEVDPIGVTSGAQPTTLLVVDKDLERAREIYDAYFAGEIAADENQATDSI